MRKTIRAAIKKLTEGESVVLATIVDTKGSTARKAGAKMLMFPDGEFQGTVGGGLIEARTIERAKEILNTGRSEINHFDLTGKALEETDMERGGTETILIERLEASDQDLINLLNKAKELLEEKKRATLISLITVNQGDSVTVHKGLVDEKDEIIFCTGAFSNLMEGMPVKISSAATKQEFSKVQAMQYYSEPLLSRGELIIVGGGHISFSLQRIASTVDFATYVIDDRSALLNWDRFPFADGLVEVDESYLNVFKGFKVDESTFIVICTKGHSTDQVVLSQALSTRAGFIGMIGSTRKRQTIYKALIEEGFSENDLCRVHCPVGIPIGDETPEEISVGIAAELIKCRSEMNSFKRS